MTKRAQKPPPPENEPGLTPETAEKVLLADLANVLQKAKSGKPLTKYERALIANETRRTAADPAPLDLTEAAPGDQPWPPWAKSIAEAARITGVTRATLHTWRKKEGCPAFKANGRVNLEELRAWMVTTGKTAGQESPTVEAARLRVYAAQAEKLERENRIARGETLLFSDFEKFAGAAMARFDSTLDRALLSELPAALQGLKATQIKAKLQATKARVIDELRTAFEKQGAKLEQNGTTGN